MTPQRKTKKIKGWAIRLPFGIAHCVCHNGNKMEAIFLDKKAAQIFARCLKDMNSKVIPCEILIKN